MIVNCMKMKGYKPVKGNEKEICEFLLEHDFYKNFLIEKANDNFKFFHKNIPLGGYYYNYGEDCFDNEDDFFVKLNEDGSISIFDKEQSSYKYVAMKFNFNKTNDFDWVSWLFNSPNVKSLHKNLITNNIEILCIPSTIFKIREGSILIFNKNTEELYDVLDGSSRTIEDVLLENGYAVHGNIKRILSLKNSKNREG